MRALAQGPLRAGLSALRRAGVVFDQVLDIRVLELGQRQLRRVLHRLRGEPGAALRRQRQDERDPHRAGADRRLRLLRQLLAGRFGLAEIAEVAEIAKLATPARRQRQARDDAKSRRHAAPAAHDGPVLVRQLPRHGSPERRFPRHQRFMTPAVFIP